MAGKYKAFISYSHRDEAFARWLHGRLERWSVPRELIGRETGTGKVLATLRPIFRDRDDFSGGSSLQEATRNALAESDAMIVICSPASAASPYVNEEIRSFKMLGRGHRIFAVIIAGEPGSETENCFPEWLRKVPDEHGNALPNPVDPIAADARDIGDGRQRAAAKLIAGLLGVPFDEIVRREEKSRRNQRAMLAGAGLGAFAFATTFAAYALYQSYQAGVVIDRSVFSIGGILQTTETLPDDESQEGTKRSMLREQCDLMDGLTIGNAKSSKAADAICYFQRASAGSPENPPEKKLATLCAWRDRLLEPMVAKEPRSDDVFAAVYALTNVYDEIHANSDRAPACARDGRDTAPDHLAFLIQSLEDIGAKRPDDVRLRVSHESAVWRLIDMREAINDWDGSAAVMRNAATLRRQQMEEISTETPNPAAFEYGVYLRRLSWLELEHLNGTEAALSDGTAAMTHWRAVQHDNPLDFNVAYQMLLAHNVVGDAQIAAAKPDEARATFEAGIALAETTLQRLGDSDDDRAKQIRGTKDYMSGRLATIQARSAP